MWLEAMYASMSISALCGVTLGINALFPAETKRFLRIVRAEITSRIPMKRRRPTVELALHAGVEVDMKWWDEEFAKLSKRTTIDLPSSPWYRLMDMQIATAVDIERRIMSITDGDLTYSTAHLHEGEAIIKLKREVERFEREHEEECKFCEYEEVRTYANPYVRRYKTGECWACQEMKMGVGI